MIPAWLDAAMHSVHAWFAHPEPVLGLALARIALGLALAYDGARMIREHARWYGPDALRIREARLPRALDPFAWCERLGLPTVLVPVAMTLCALAFAAGAMTTVCGLLLLGLLVAIPPRNLLIVYGGDAFGRTLLSLLILSPCGAALSIDRAWIDGSLGLDVQAAPWAGRLVLIEVALLYAYAFLGKVAHPAWRRGTVMSDLLRNRNFARGGLPRVLLGAGVGALLTWGALAAELAFVPGLLIPATAAWVCLAAIVFHLAIARLLDVHLFSYVMVAGLLACLPREAIASSLALASTGTALPSLPTPSLDLGQGLAVLVAIAYVGFAITWDPPFERWRSTWLRRALQPVLGPLHWTRSWHLFVRSCPQQVEIEIVGIDEHGALRRWPWHRPDGLADASVAEASELPPRTPGHRFQRFKLSVVEHPRAQAVLVEHVQRRLEQAGHRMRALSIEALFIDVQGDRPIVGSLDVHTQIARSRTEGFDFEACARLLLAVRGPATRARLLELVVLAALDATLRDHPRDGLAPAIARLERDAATPRLDPETFDRLHTLGQTIADLQDRSQLLALLHAVRPITPPISTPPIPSPPEGIPHADPSTDPDDLTARARARHAAGPAPRTRDAGRVRALRHDPVGGSGRSAAALQAG